VGVGCVRVYVYLHMNIQFGAYIEHLVDELRAAGRKQQDALEEVCMWVLGVWVCICIFT